MTTNERIARHLGWTSREFLVAGTVCTGWARPDGLGESVPDYEHSLDALLEPLGVLQGKGWEISIETNVHAVTVWHFDMKRRFRHGFKTLEQMVEKAALAVAEALEASK